MQDSVETPKNRLPQRSVAAGRRVNEHLDARADHVCVKVVDGDPEEEMLAYQRIAPALIR